jgi:DNA-binding IclR family transcriptional regulator
MLPSQPNQSLIDAIECLEAVIASGEPAGVRELARQLGINRVKVNRLLMTLAHHGLLERTSEGQYRPGHGVHALAAMANEGSGLLRVAAKHLKPWWSEGYRVTVGVLWRQYICYLLRAMPDRPFEEGIGGRRGPALESSAGLMLLASLPKKALAAMPLEPFGTLASGSATLAELLEDARRHGYGRLDYADGTTSLGVCIGAPPTAAVAVSRPRMRMDRIEPIIERLRATADAIAAELSPAR